MFQSSLFGKECLTCSANIELTDSGVIFPGQVTGQVSVCSGTGDPRAALLTFTSGAHAR